ncbi:MAG: GTPase protein [Myxococcaceae bacterium]|nr:GTPase protein [Myxococcaceae bacterium]
MNEELFSGIKVLVALAQADGTIHDGERIAIENALDGAELPEGQTVATLLEATIDLTVELARITSEEARKRTYMAACALVYVDGEVSPDEQRMLARVSAAFGLSGSEGKDEGFAKFTSVTPPAMVTEVDDATERERIVTGEIASAASFSAVLASASLPIAAESCLFTNNVRLSRNIGLIYGHDADDAFWRTFVGNVVGSAASWFAITSLLKLIPGSGNASSAAYASTFALGRATRFYFEKAEDVSPSALREAFVDAKREGRTLAREATAAITARREQLQAPKAALDADLAAGTITEIAYANKLVTLA